MITSSRSKAGQRERDLVVIFAGPLDIVRGIMVFRRPLTGSIEKVEETVKADGRPPEKGGIEGPHSHLLRVSNMGTRAPNTWSGARRVPKRAPSTKHQPGKNELESEKDLSRGAAINQLKVCYYKDLRDSLRQTP